MHSPSADGVTIDGWLIRPRKFDASKKYPIIVNVYGEPAGSTVNDSWAGNNRLLLAALADDGYLVASFDNRGTPAPKGRALAQSHLRLRRRARLAGTGRRPASARRHRIRMSTSRASASSAGAAAVP